MIMKNILWYQPEKTGDPDIVCQDGEIIYGYPREVAFSYLKFASDKCIDHDLPWCGEVSFPSSKDKSKKAKVFFLKGKFKSVDEHGRTLTFMYLAAKGYDNLEALNNVLHVVHQELSDDTLRCLSERKRKQIRTIVLIVIVVLLVIMLTVLKHGSEI